MQTVTSDGRAHINDGQRRNQRPCVCVFVYNNCTSDPRVLKQAASLTSAGYAVRVIAVLDKRTTPHEVRDGIEIIRIDRQPIHYRVLRVSRRVRRALRLGRARFRRKRRKARLVVARRLGRRPRSPAPIGGGASTGDGPVPSIDYFSHLEPTSTPQPLQRSAEAQSADDAAVVRQVRTGPTFLTMLVDGVVYVPRRGFLALRWRAMHRSLLLRHTVYRYRARRRRAQARRLARRSTTSRLTRETQRSARTATPSARPKPSTVPSPRTYTRVRRLIRPAAPPLAVPAGVVLVLARGIGSAIGRLGRAIDRRVSRICYRAVMVFHKPLMFTDYYRRAYRQLRNEQFDAFHAHDLNTLPVAWLLARRTNTPLVYDAHELYCEISTLSRREALIWRLIERRTIRRATHVVTVCESIAGELKTRYGIPKPTVVLNAPTHDARPRFPDPGLLRRKVGLEHSDEPIILYHGGFARNRGLDQLVAAAHYLERGVIVLMGSGMLEDDIRDHVQREGLGDRILITSPVPSAELLSYVVGANVGVIPYRAVGLNNYYTTPNKLFEYMAAGIPIVGSRFPELVRFVDGLGLGVTFDPESPGDLAAAVNYVIGDAGVQADFRQNAQQAGETFTWEREAQNILDIYAAISRRPAVRR